MSNPHLKLIMQLAEKHPKCFSVLETRRKPLKIGIHHDLHATGEYDSRELSNALRYYCCNPKYLLKCSNGVKRVDLDGNPCGEVTQQEAAQSSARYKDIKRRIELRKEERRRLKEQQHNPNFAKPKLKLKLTVCAGENSKTKKAQNDTKKENIPGNGRRSYDQAGQIRCPV